MAFNKGEKKDELNSVYTKVLGQFNSGFDNEQDSKHIIVEEKKANEIEQEESPLGMDLPLNDCLFRSRDMNVQQIIAKYDDEMKGPFYADEFELPDIASRGNIDELAALNDDQQ